MTVLQPGVASRQVSVGDRQIFVAEAGEGFPLVLLHGGGPGASGLSNFSRNVDALAMSFRVIVPDLPGYGRSTKRLHRDDLFGDLAGAIAGTLDALEIERAHFVGNSLGGSTALRLALDRPQRVGAMVLMGPGGIDTTRSIPTAGLRRLFGYYTGEGPTLEKLRTFIRGYLVFDGTQLSDEMIEQRFAASIDPEVVASPPLQRPRSLAAALRTDFTRDRRLASCTVPTLTVWGLDDKVNRPSGGRSLQRRMRNCDLYLFANTGHWVQWERASEFNATTAAFLNQHTPAAARR